MHKIWEVTLEEGKELPRFTVVIPTYNCALTIAWTLNSLSAQTHRDLEVILIDSGSTDRTLEVARRAYKNELRIYSIAEMNLAEMYNRGISLATGEYVSLLLPGDSYLSDETLQMIGTQVANQNHPDMVYCGCLLRDPNKEPHILLNKLTLDNLKAGRQPTSLQSCWYKVHSLKSIGKLNPNYKIRAGFDLFCRLYLAGDRTVALLKRVLVDHDREYQVPGALIRRGFENFQVIKSHFGLKAALAWWLGQDHIQFLRWWWHSKRKYLWS